MLDINVDVVAEDTSYISEPVKVVAGVTISLHGVLLRCMQGMVVVDITPWYIILSTLHHY